MLCLQVVEEELSDEVESVVLWLQVVEDGSSEEVCELLSSAFCVSLLRARLPIARVASMLVEGCNVK